MNIIPGVGVHGLRLGMSQAEVIKIMGKPDKIVEEKCVHSTWYFYNEWMITVSFDWDEMNTLGWIKCSNPEVSLWNHHLIGMHSDVLMKLLKEHKVMEIEYEEYTSFESIDCEDIGIEFILEFNMVQEVTVGFIFDEAGDIKGIQ